MEKDNTYGNLQRYMTRYRGTGAVQVQKHTYLYDIYGFVRVERETPPFQNFSIEKKNTTSIL